MFQLELTYIPTCSRDYPKIARCSSAEVMMGPWIWPNAMVSWGPKDRRKLNGFLCDLGDDDFTVFSCFFSAILTVLLSQGFHKHQPCPSPWLPCALQILERIPRVSPVIIYFLWGFSTINHRFWGIPIYGNPMLLGKYGNRNFSSVFGHRTSFRAKGFTRALENRNFPRNAI